MSKGTYSFTTPIYYVNAAPHLGTAYTTITVPWQNSSSAVRLSKASEHSEALRSAHESQVDELCGNS